MQLVTSSSCFFPKKSGNPLSRSEADLTEAALKGSVESQVCGLFVELCRALRVREATKMAYIHWVVEVNHMSFPCINAVSGISSFQKRYPIQPSLFVLVKNCLQWVEEIRFVVAVLGALSMVVRFDMTIYSCMVTAIQSSDRGSLTSPRSTTS